MKIKKINLLLGLLLTLFLALPTTCNAEETPTLKWEKLNQDQGYEKIHSDLYNINNDILVVHTASREEYNYIRLYNNAGEIKQEYKQGGTNHSSFLINNKYLGLVQSQKITLLNLKDETIYKEIDISKMFDWDDFHYAYADLLFANYYNEKIVLLFYYYNTKSYCFYTLDLDGNIEMSKKGIHESYNVEYYLPQQIAIDNTLYGIDQNKIIAISMDTGEISKEIQLNNMNVKNIIKYKDGILLCGSHNGYMTIEYYDLKTGTTQVKQFEEEGTIYTVSTDNKDNLYIAGKYIDNNTTGKAYFSKYTINNWSFKKKYESFYEKKDFDEYFYTDILVLKSNKIILAGNTYDSGKYREGLNFVVYYDGTKNYKIDKVIKGNGNLDIVESEEEDNEVKYQVKPGFGYKLISLKIVTESGKEIEVSDDYSFIMPDENITITAIFEPIISNPVTGSNIIKVILLLTFSISVVYLITKSIRKRKFNN